MNKFAVMAFALALGLSSCKQEAPLEEPVFETHKTQQSEQEVARQDKDAVPVGEVTAENENALKIKQVLEGFQSDLFKRIESGDKGSKNLEDLLKTGLYDKLLSEGVELDEETQGTIKEGLKTIFDQAEEKAREKSTVEISRGEAEEYPYLKQFFSGPPGESKPETQDEGATQDAQGVEVGTATREEAIEKLEAIIKGDFKPDNKALEKLVDGKLGVDEASEETAKPQVTPPKKDEKSQQEKGKSKKPSNPKGDKVVEIS